MTRAPVCRFVGTVLPGLLLPGVVVAGLLLGGAVPAAAMGAPRATATPAARPAAMPAALQSAVSLPAAAPATVTRLTATVGALPRQWVLVAPPTANAPIDLVIALHGVGNNGGEMRAMGFENLAIPAGVALAFPDAAYGAWNDGRPGADVLSPDGRPADDIAFLRSLIFLSGVQMNRPIRSVGIIGFSNGAMMAARAACEMSDLVSVVAIVAGSAPEGFQSVCRPRLPVSVAIVAARGDPVVPYGGGQVAPFNGRPRGRVSGVDATVAFWAYADTCRATDDAGTPPAVPPVGATEARSCASTRHVERFATDDAAHDWRRAGGFDTTTVVWSFVRAELPRFADLNDLARAGLVLDD
ncbi:MAG: alpha/beta hydrolase family esterase [Acidimicrobiia bacterium]